MIVYCNLDLTGYILPGNDKVALKDIWHNSFHRMFRPLETVLETVNRYGGVERVVFHTRFTSLLDDFKDIPDNRLLHDKKVKLMKRVVDIISEKAETLQHDNIYVLSDSVAFLRYIKENTGHKVTAGTLVHTDHSNSEGSHLKTFADFFFMAGNRQIFQVVAGNMYGSNFSRYAAMAGGCGFSVLRG